MPGVLIIEGMAQTAGAICAKATGGGNNIVYFMTIDNAKFRKPLFPVTGSSITSPKSSSAATSGGSIAKPRLMAPKPPRRTSEPCWLPGESES
jgi:3-hydroxymyristoyl/3-hydroxydecanoyl-(acyl carrier protein) dehydratase